MKKTIISLLIITVLALSEAYSDRDIYILKRGDIASQEINSVNVLHLDSSGELIDQWTVNPDDMRLRRRATDRYMSLSGDGGKLAIQGFVFVRQEDDNVPVFATFDLSEKTFSTKTMVGEGLRQRSVATVDGNQFFYTGKTDLDGIRYIEVGEEPPGVEFTSVTFALQQVKVIGENLWASRGTGIIHHGVFYLPWLGAIEGEEIVEVTLLDGEGWDRSHGEYRDFDVILSEGLLFVGASRFGGLKQLKVFQSDTTTEGNLSYDDWDLFDFRDLPIRDNIIGVQAAKNGDGSISLYYSTLRDIYLIEFYPGEPEGSRWSVPVKLAPDFLSTGEVWGGMVVVMSATPPLD